MGLPESGWPSTGVAKTRGAAGRPPGRTARLRPGSQDSEGLEAAVSLSAPWFPHLSRGSPFLKVQGPLSRPGRSRTGSWIAMATASGILAAATPPPTLSLLQQAEPWASSQPLGIETEALGWPPGSQTTHPVGCPAPLSPPEHTPLLLRLRAQPSHCHGDCGFTRAMLLANLNLASNRPHPERAAP